MEGGKKEGGRRGKLKKRRKARVGQWEEGKDDRDGLIDRVKKEGFSRAVWREGRKKEVGGGGELKKRWDARVARLDDRGVHLR